MELTPYPIDDIIVAGGTKSAPRTATRQVAKKPPASASRAKPRAAQKPSAKRAKNPARRG